jgi:hypothetical protein
MLRFITLFMLAFLTSCTYSINLVNSEGTASDVVDQNRTPNPQVSSTVSIPTSQIGASAPDNYAPKTPGLNARAA